VGLRKTPGFQVDSSTAEDKGKGEVEGRGRGKGGTHNEKGCVRNLGRACVCSESVRNTVDIQLAAHFTKSSDYQADI